MKDERALISTTLISPCHWKTIVYFCLRKKRPGNAFLTLILNFRKIAQKNKLCHSKQQQIGYLMHMMLFSHWLFWLKNWRFSENSCKGFILFLRWSKKHFSSILKDFQLSKIISDLRVRTRKNRRYYVYLPIPFNWSSLPRGYQTITIINHCSYCFDDLW